MCTDNWGDTTETDISIQYEHEQTMRGLKEIHQIIHKKILDDEVKQIFLRAWRKSCPIMFDKLRGD